MNAENNSSVDILINKKQKDSLIRVKKYYYYTFIPIVIGISWLAISFSQVRNLNNKVNKLIDSIAVAKMDLRDYRDSVRMEKQSFELLKYMKDSLQVEYLRYLQYGKSIQPGYNSLEQSIQANNYLKAQLNNFNTNKALNIWYYQKTIDAERVHLALGELGYLNVRVAPTDNTLLVNGETNAVAFGPDVKLEDLKVILLTLIRAGFKIEYVYPSERHKNIPALIQILRTEVYKNGIAVTKTPLTVEQIIRARNKEELISR